MSLALFHIFSGSALSTPGGWRIVGQEPYIPVFSVEAQP